VRNLRKRALEDRDEKSGFQVMNHEVNFLVVEHSVSSVLVLFVHQALLKLKDILQKILREEVVIGTLIFVVVFCALPVSNLDCYAWVQVQMLLNIMDNGLSTSHIVAVGHIRDKESGGILITYEGAFTSHKRQSA
jgi:hypothetical protein